MVDYCMFRKMLHKAVVIVDEVLNEARMQPCDR